MRKLLPALLLSACALLAASQFWDAKPFSSWSDSEVRQLMSNSPWAHEVAIPDPSVASWDTGSLGGGGKRGHGGGSFGNPTPGSTTGPKIKVAVFWESALPGRQALARLKFGSEAAESREARSLLEPEQDNYIIVVTGLPALLVKQSPEKIRDGLAAKTSLSAKGRPSIHPGKAEVFVDGKSVGIYFEFPRTFALAPDDKEVDFATKVADIDIKTIFHPAEMLFAGKLEL